MRENTIIRSSVSVSIATSTGYRSTETNSDHGPEALVWAVREATRLLTVAGLGERALDAAREAKEAVAADLALVGAAGGLPE